MMDTPMHKLTRPIGERLPHKLSLGLAPLRPSDFDELLDGRLTDAMRDAIDYLMYHESAKRRAKYG